MFKKSFYNVFVDHLASGSDLLYNTYSRAFGVMDASTRVIYDEIEGVYVDKLNEKGKDTVTILYKNGFIVDDTVDETNELRLRSTMAKFARNSLILIIAPTLDCNMACPYCFENKKKGSMSEATQEALFQFVKQSIEKHPYKNMHVTWYGGEPLLELAVIRNLSGKLIDLCVSKDVPYSSSVITNGVLLTPDVGAMLKNECQVSQAQITIDGLPSYHNTRRILIDGRESFGIIADNIDANKDIIRIYVRVNVDEENKENIRDLADYFIRERGWGTKPYFYLAPVVEYENNCGSVFCISEEDFTSMNRYVMEKRVEQNKTVIQELYPPGKTLSCAAIQMGSYVVDPDGSLYTCMNVIGNKERRIGTVVETAPNESEYAKWLLHEPAPKCQMCQYLPICGGGCPYEYFLNGDVTCDKRVFSFSARLKLAYSEYAKAKAGFC